MKSEILTSIISATSILTGSLIGALFSYLISDKMYKKQLINEKKRDQIEKEYDRQIRNKSICDNVNQIRLDIANAIFQSMRTLKYSDNHNLEIHLLPYSHNYSSIISTLNHLFSIKELSDIYQLYAIVEKTSDDINDYKKCMIENKNKIINEFTNILMKIYGENYDKIILLDPDSVGYIDLFESSYTLTEFKSIFMKLEKYCNIKNLLT